MTKKISPSKNKKKTKKLTVADLKKLKGGLVASKGEYGASENGGTECDDDGKSSGFKSPGGKD